MPVGRVCSGTEVDDGRICDPYRRHHPGECSTPKINLGETAPMEEATRTLASVELSSKEVASTRKPTRELDMPMAADTKLVGAPHPFSTI